MTHDTNTPAAAAPLGSMSSPHASPGGPGQPIPMPACAQQSMPSSVGEAMESERWRNALVGLCNTDRIDTPEQAVANVKARMRRMGMPAARQPVIDVDRLDAIRANLIADTRQVFDANGTETPQSVRDVIEYVDSWLSVFAQKQTPVPSGPALPQPSDSGADGLPRMEKDARAALLYALWHHQGGSSTVGQPIRRMLGIGQHDHLTKEQHAEAHRVQDALGIRVEAQPKPSGNAETRECGNSECDWKGLTDRMLGGIGPLCPECGETTEPSGNAGELPPAWPRVFGVSRDMHPRCLVLSPSVDDVRAIHNALTANQGRAQGMTEQDDRDLAVGRLWRENSSLEEWFPLTAEDLESHKRMLRSAVSDLAAICAALGLDDNYNGPHEALSAIESLKAQQPADAAAFRMLVSAGNRIEAEAEEFESPDGMAVSIGINYWHEFDAALDRARAALAAQPSGQEQPTDADEDAYVIHRMGQLLARVAVALRGPEKPLHRHGYADLPERAASVMQELAALRAQQPSGQAQDGWQSVPVSPSIAMCIRGAAVTDEAINGHAAAQVYAAMLHAAPCPDHQACVQAQQDAMDAARWRAYLAAWFNDSMHDRNTPIGAAMHALSMAGDAHTVNMAADQLVAARQGEGGAA